MTPENAMPSTRHIDLPPALLAAITKQSGVLFLGAGASLGARHPREAALPTADTLRDQLCDYFLAGKLKTRSLAHVAEMCMSETDLLSVQTFVRDIFLPFMPSPAHLIIPRFFWHAIVTTNYDLLVETAYSEEHHPKQELVTFVKDGQRVDTALKAKVNGLPFLKLHGSIDRIDDRDIPLILSTEQYVRHQTNRRRLFDNLRNYGYEFPFLFCGYSISDQHIQELLFDLSDATVQRPRYYAVNPDFDDVEVRYWAKHRVTCIKATFAEFLTALETQIPSIRRSLPISLGGGTESVRTFYRVPRASESDVLKMFLSADADHVRSGMAATGTTARRFYIGADTGWAPIESNLDIPRRITDSVIVDAILTDERDRRSPVDLHVIKGPAGHGKTTTLRRVAWDASVTFSQLCLFVREEGSLRLDALRELCDLVQQRVFVFVDRAALRVDEIEATVRDFMASNTPLTIVTAERDNEWNVRCGSLDEFLTQEYPLQNLTELEVHALLAKLEEHDALGRLADFSYQERVSEFMNRAERQLLVALHEATLGKPFEEIVKDEFDRIVPAEAQTLYLDVCTLNRLGVPVRAGLIARVSGIRFEDFRRRFLAPLEYVVRSHEDRYVGDRMYAARHQHIADLVFQLALTEPEQRFDQLVRILDGINIDYSSDNEAFRALVRGKAMAEIFPSQELARRFYERATLMVRRDAHLLQQRGIFEMTHPDGDLKRAEHSVLAALELAPYDRSIKHTLGNLRRRQANAAKNPLLRDKLRRESRTYLGASATSDARTAHGFHTMALVLIDELRDVLGSVGDGELDRLESDRVTKLVRQIEATVREGEQRFPEDELLLTAEAQLRGLLNEHEKAFIALQTAFRRNPRSEFVATRLSRKFEERGELSQAKDVLLKCMRQNTDGKAVNFTLAKLYMRHGSKEERGQVLELLRRSFTEGDTNFDAQYWTARELFLNGQLEEATRTFGTLHRAVGSPTTRNRVRGLIRGEDGRVKRYSGVVSNKEEGYLFVTAEGFPRDVFCHYSQASEGYLGGNWAEF